MMAFDAAWWVRRVRDETPLVHNITNFVAMPFVANTLLAAGAAPVMAHAVEEVADMVRLARALVLNIGTLDPRWVESMEVAARAARTAQVPVVLDPVGAGATPYRTRVAEALLTSAAPAVVRGNGGEILTLAGGVADVRGVDAGQTTAGPEDVRRLAASTGAVVAATGAIDWVSDGRRLCRIANGDPWLGRVTGTGCALSALVGAFVGVAGPTASPADRLEATCAALVYFEVAAERARDDAKGPGTFAVYLLDELAKVPAEVVARAARVQWDG
jgi:hydroxyethylthiazole kinase